MFIKTKTLKEQILEYPNKEEKIVLASKFIGKDVEVVRYEDEHATHIPIGTRGHIVGFCSDVFDGLAIKTQGRVDMVYPQEIKILKDDEKVTDGDVSEVIDGQLHLSKGQIARNDQIDNAVFNCIIALTENPTMEWDMEIIGEVTDSIKDILIEFGLKVRQPAIVTETDGTQRIVE